MNNDKQSVFIYAPIATQHMNSIMYFNFTSDPSVAYKCIYIICRWLFTCISWLLLTNKNRQKQNRPTDTNVLQNTLDNNV